MEFMGNGDLATLIADRVENNFPTVMDEPLVAYVTMGVRQKQNKTKKQKISFFFLMFFLESIQNRL